VTDSADTPHTASTHPVLQLLEILRDLDRCQHGRHEGDTCVSCGEISQGNPVLPIGTQIGYTLYGEPIYLPRREDKNDPAAWLKAPDHVTDDRPPLPLPDSAPAQQHEQEDSQ
jgi:hypothetical protein